MCNEEFLRGIVDEQADALYVRPAPFGRNRETRSREGTGRKNSPKQCPERCRAEKGQLLNSVATGQTNSKTQLGLAEEIMTDEWFPRITFPTQIAVLFAHVLV